ncbi:MAG: hypothetical protein ACRDT6_00185 [Micromonosporaceae bacterium]
MAALINAIRTRAAFAALAPLLFAGLLLPGTAHAQEADTCLAAAGEEIAQHVPAMVCGVMVVHASGHAGITLDVPRQTDLPDSAFVVELLDGASYAWVGLADRNPEACGRDPFFGMCLTHKQYRLDVGDTPWVLSNDPTLVDEGRHELYVISDGAVRVTMSFTGLTGRAELHARGAIRATSHRLQARCATAPDCERAGWGGAAHTVSHPGWVGVIAYAWNPIEYIDDTGVPYPATRAATSCLYPWYGSGGVSTDPDDHPFGCSLLPTEESDWNENALWFAGNTAIPLGGSNWMIWENLGPDGPVYAGFTAQSSSTAGGGGYVAYGFWLEQGIKGEAG